MKKVFLLFLIAGIVIINGCTSSKKGEIDSIKDMLYDTKTDTGNYNLAVANKDASYCERIQDQDYKLECKGVATGNFDFCEQMSGDKEDCVFYAAFREGNRPSKVSYCEQLTDTADKIDCKAILLKDISLCKQHSDDIDKSSCLSYVAASTNDPSLCTKHSELEFNYDSEPANEIEDDCYMRVAVENKNHALCNNIKDNLMKSFCQKS